MLALLIWILKTLFFIGLFQFLIPPIVNGLTGNSWLKLPIFILFSIPSAILMAWLNYPPYLLFVILLLLNYRNLKALTQPKFEAEAGMRINKPLFWVSTYSYIVFSCGLALFLQMQIVQTISPGQEIPPPLWKYLLGYWKWRLPMFDFLGQGSFYLWLAIGIFISIVGGFASVSHGAFFSRVAGEVFIAFCNFYALIGIIVKIGFSNSIVAAIFSLFVFWCTMGIGRRFFFSTYKKIL